MTVTDYQNLPINNTDEIITKVACTADNPHKDLVAAQEKLRAEVTTFVQQAQLGQMGQNGPKITPSMCNAGYNGQFDTGNEYGLQDIANAVGRNMAVQREN